MKRIVIALSLLCLSAAYAFAQTADGAGKQARDRLCCCRYCAGYTMEEIFDFDKTLGIVLEWAAKDGETLVVVTGDHATGGMTLLSGSIQDKRIRVNFSTSGHNGIFLPVFAWGPHSEDFVGVYENTELSNKIRNLIR